MFRYAKKALGYSLVALCISLRAAHYIVHPGRIADGIEERCLCPLLGHDQYKYSTGKAYCERCFCDL